MASVRKLLSLLFSLAVICLSATAAVANPHPASDLLKIHFMNAGHGDSTFINCPDGKMILINAGSSSGYPGGKLRYYLLKQGELVGKVLDTLIITQPEADNYNLVSRVLDKVPVNQLYLAGTQANYPDVKFNNWLGLIEQQRKRFLAREDFSPENATNIDIACGAAQVQILLPPIDTDKTPGSAKTLLVMISYGDFKALLAGDAATATQAAILQRYPKDWLAADVLQIGNQGRLDGATGEEWLRAIRPKAAVISAGAENDAGQPGKQLIERLEPYTIDNQRTHAMAYTTWDDARESYFWHYPTQFSEAIYSTATNGTLVVRSDGSRFKIDLGK
jgi:beta-lactamase superfamily II metal-dependent hydrolase